jgi:hypothetical protein
MNHTGGCLCGAVRYAVSGKLRDVLECHCSMCRRTHGHIGAYTAVPRSALELIDATGLRWYHSSDKARRGFCGTCGSSLFWDPAGKDYIAVAAGTLDAPTGLKTVLQIHTADSGDYYTIRADVPQRPGGSAGG